jgi:hypothetical protein
MVDCHAFLCILLFYLNVWITGFGVSFFTGLGNGHEGPSMIALELQFHTHTHRNQKNPEPFGSEPPRAVAFTRQQMKQHDQKISFSP